MKFEKILKLELKEYEIKLLLIVINKEITILNNTDLEINQKELFELHGLFENKKLSKEIVPVPLLPSALQNAGTYE